MALATLSIDIVAKLESFEQDLGKAARASQKTADDIGAAFGVIKNLAGGLFAGLSVDALISMTREVLNGLDAMTDLAEATGATVENISALEDIARRTGGTFDTVATSLVKFNQALNTAKPGSDAEEAITALGLSIKELQALDPAEALLRVAAAQRTFADDGNKARLMQVLFNKSLQEVLPFLNDVADKGKLVATVTTAQAEEAKRLNNEIASLRTEINSLARDLVGSLAASINKTIELFRQGAAEGKSYYRTLVDEQLRMLGFRSGQQDYEIQLGKIEDRLRSGNLVESERIKLLKERTEVEAKLSAAMEKAGRRVQPEGSWGEPIVPKKPSLPAIGGAGSKPPARSAAGGGARTVAEEIDDNRRALASYVSALESELARTQELTSEQKTLNMLQSLGTLGQVPQVRELVLAMAKQIDAIKAQEVAAKAAQKATQDWLEAAIKAQEAAAKADATASTAAQKATEDWLEAAVKADLERTQSRERAEAAAAAAVERARETSARYLESINREQVAMADSNLRLREHMEEIGQTKDAVERLRLARLDATIGLQEQKLATMDLTNSSEAEIEAMKEKIRLLREQRALMGATGIVQAAADSRAETDKASKEFADTLHADLKNAFSMAFRDSSGDPLKAFGDAIANVIFSRAAIALAEALTNSILSGSGGSGGGLMSWFGDLFSFDGGGFTGSGSRAGGLDGSGGFLAMLHPQEQVLDLTRGQGGGSVSVTQNIRIDSRSDQATILAAMSMAKEQAKTEILRSRRSGGVFA